MATATTGSITLGGGTEDPDGEVADEKEWIQVDEEDLVQLVRVRAAELGALGELFDAVCEHVCTGARTLLSPERESDKVIGQIKNIVRERISVNFIL